MRACKPQLRETTSPNCPSASNRASAWPLTEQVLETAPLSVLYLYAPAASYYYAVLLWSSWAALVGVATGVYLRSACAHYIAQPWRPVLDYLLIVLYVVVVGVTYSNRQEAFTLSSSYQRNATPTFSYADQSWPYWSSPQALLDDGRAAGDRTRTSRRVRQLRRSTLWRSRVVSLHAAGVRCRRRHPHVRTDLRRRHAPPHHKSN